MIAVTVVEYDPFFVPVQLNKTLCTALLAAELQVHLQGTAFHNNY